MRLDVDVPGADAAEERSWRIVEAAYAAREPATRRRRRGAAVALAVGAVAVVAAAAGPSGRALLGDVREAVGIQRPARAVFSLPEPGRLLVASAGHGVWLVSPDGGRRRLGDWDEAQWSPRGLFVVAARRDTVAALEPDGDERWSLARAGARSPRWSPSGYRVAYVAREGVRVVAGDGTGDRLLARGATGPLAWHPTREHVLAYLVRGVLVERHVDTGRVLSRRAVGPLHGLAWSSDGERLALLWRGRLQVVDRAGTVVQRLAGRVVAASFAPGTHLLAASVRRAPQSELVLVDPDRGTRRVLFTGPGSFGELAWGPVGRWLLLDWPAADQWVFLTRDGRDVVGVGAMREQFPRGSAPLRVAGGWCCVSAP